MLDLYKDSQKEFYEAICHSILDKKRISHAYFIETSTFANGKELALSFAKFLLCPNHYSNLDQCENCSLCHLVDEGVDDHIYIVEPDGMWIKKEQIEVLKDVFSTKSMDELPRIYIVYEADKLNKSAANSMLKFIEEPEEGIIAILVAENRYQILPTILSRCQIYTLIGEQEEIKEVEGDDTLCDFILSLEKRGTETICYIKDLWFSFYSSKEDMQNAFSRMEQLFLDALHYKVKDSSSISCDFYSFLCQNNTVSSLIRKLNVIRFSKEAIPYNVNLPLWMDKFIIDYVGGE